MCSSLARFNFTLQNIKPRNYKTLRKELGKSIFLGLEMLVAGDIIATVVTEPTMSRVLILGMIVIIRTFLSLSIEVEIETGSPGRKKLRRAEACDAVYLSFVIFFFYDVLNLHLIICYIHDH